MPCGVGGVPTGAGLVDGGVPRALVAGEVWGGVGGEGWGLVGKAWGESKSFGSGRVGVLFFESWRVDLVTRSRGLPRAVWGSGKGGLGGARARGGPRASVPGGVGGRGTGPRDGANFATCVVFLSFQGRSKFRNVCRIFVVSVPCALVAGELGGA